MDHGSRLSHEGSAGIAFGEAGEVGPKGRMGGEKSANSELWKEGKGRKKKKRKEKGEGENRRERDCVFDEGMDYEPLFLT